MKLPHNSIDAFQFGAMLDMRVRLAMDMLIHNPSFNLAIDAMDQAERLFMLAEERGLIEEIPEFIEERLKQHVRRGMQTQYEQRSYAQSHEQINRSVTAALASQGIKGPRNS